MNILSITWNLSPQMFDLGGFGIKWYGFLFAMGFFLAYILLLHLFKNETVKGKILDMITVYVFFATVIGARLGHVFFYEWSYYKDHLGDIIKVWEGGLASHGAAIAIILVLILFIWKYKVNTLWLFDRLAIVIPVVAAFVRFGNLMNSEIYGVTTKLPWGFIFVLDKEAGLLPRHPTQLYEAFSYLLISLVLYLLWRKKKADAHRGLFVGIFLTVMFTARFLIEFVKTEQMPFEKGMMLDMGQWLSIPFILLGVFFIIIAYVKTPDWLRWINQKNANQ